MANQYRSIDQPAMSDKTIIISVEDLIYQAFTFYSSKDNRVDFKLLQSIFLILARELRLLQQDVEIKFDDIIELARGKTADGGYDDGSGTYSSSSDDDERGRRTYKTRERKGQAGKEEKRDKKDRGKKGDKTERGGKDGKGEKEERKGRRGKGEKENGKTSSKDRERKGHSKDRGEKDERSRGRDKSSKDKHEKDERSRGRDKSSRRKRGEDDVDEGGRERRRDRERGGERGADGRGGSRGEHEADGRGGRGGEREADGRGGRGGEREADGRGGRGGEREADGRGGRGGEREDRDAQRQNRGGLGREFGGQTSGTSITVSEATRGGPGGRGSTDKILVAERGPAARGRPARIGSIEVVTAFQFALLMEAVKQLEQITGPLPKPALPEDQTLRQDLVKGRASLQDTMQAMQLGERVKAAEQGLKRLAELLTELALSEMLPPEFADRVEAMEEYLQDAIAEGYAAAGPDGTYGSGGPDSRGQLGTGETASAMDAKKALAARNAAEAAAAAAAAEAKGKQGVTHYEMFEVMENLQEALMKEVNILTARANHSAEGAFCTSRSVAEKMDTAVHVNTRIHTLIQQTEEYTQELSGFDSGVMTQVKNFQQHLVNMKNDLTAGLAVLDATNNNAETAALLELTERHADLVIELENTVHLHQNLYVTQHEISDGLKSIIKSVEILREQKSERAELLEGLKDKANVSLLAGLLEEKVFTVARSDIEKRLAKSYEKFNIRDATWQGALKELLAIANNKGEMIMLMSLKDASDLELNAIQKLLHKLEIMLGEPKAAILMRKLGKDATCAACMTRALMQPEDATHGKPLPLPALRRPPLGAELRGGEAKLAPPDIRDHICRRWAGGSHTLVVGNIVKKQAKNMQLQIKPTKKFEGTGSDGRYYLMEEDTQPCAECNKVLPCECPPVEVEGCPCTPTSAGDQASAPPSLKTPETRRR